MSLSKQIDQLIRSTSDDRELLAVLSVLASENWEFPQHVKSWGPQLYYRNRELFLPFIEKHLSGWALAGTTDLQGWMRDAEQNGDVRIYRFLLQAWLTDTFPWAEVGKQWATLLETAFREAPDRPARRAVLDRHDIWFDLQDEVALELYRIDPVLTAEFVIKRLSRERWYDVIYEKTAQAALDAGDEEFYFELYRRTFLEKTWRADVLRLCREVGDPSRLVAELERRHLAHPEGGISPAGFTELARQRTADVVPYLRRAIGATEFWGNDKEWNKLLDIARTEGWFDVYGGIVRTHLSGARFNELVRDLLADSALSEPQLSSWLMQFVGAKTGFGDWRATTKFETKTALALYERFPELLRGAFAPHLRVTAQDDLEELAEVAAAGGDLELVDQLSATAVAMQQPAYLQAGTNYDNWWYARHYRALTGAVFAERALRVLAQVDPFPFAGRQFIRRKNPLYALFFRPEAYLGVLPQVGELLEAPNVEVRTLGMRVLVSANDEHARRLATNHVDSLLPYLLDEAPRATRIVAFETLALASQSSAEIATRIHDRARAALDLRRRFYPRDRLIELIGRLIAGWPELRKPSEHVVIYEARA